MRIIIFIFIALGLCYYVISIPSREELVKDLRITEQEDYYHLEHWYCDEDGCQYHEINGYDSMKEAKVALEYEQEAVRKGVWYDLFGVGRLSSGAITFISLFTPVLFLLVSRLVLGKDYFSLLIDF